ncbi:MAG: hypothetical protein EOO07_15115 [Chitinophagaceae bacterium]|nr:MAG: hypothetical protein EOO07_15115 [Chitinophagaceae bacterium]
MAAAIGFGIGPVSVFVYVPLWAVNVFIILLAVWQLTKHKQCAGEFKAENWVSAAILLIIPWVLFSIFAGMGPPPVTMVDWLANATEQQVRYTILIFGGISALMGFALLKVKLEDLGERLYSSLGLTVLGLAIPLFILNMAFWGYYLTDAFRYFVILPIGNRPDWYPPVKTLFYVISVVEVALIYLATILFAIALKNTGILSIRASYWYIVIAVIGIVSVILPPSLPEPFSTAGYLAAVPAIPFIMPYLMGVRLLRFNRISD